MSNSLTTWLKGLGSAFITGLASSFLSALGISGANAMGIKIDQLVPRQLIIITIMGGAVGAASYLKQSPLPKDGGSSGISGAVAGLLLAGLLTGLVAPLTGCSTTPQRVVYQAAGTTITSADVAMQAWEDYVKQYHPPVAQEQAVKAAYEKYQASMVALIDGMEIYVTLAANSSGTNSPPSMDQVLMAQKLASQTLADLLTLLVQFGVKL